MREAGRRVRPGSHVTSRPRRDRRLAHALLHHSRVSEQRHIDLCSIPVHCFPLGWRALFAKNLCQDRCRPNEALGRLLPCPCLFASPLARTSLTPL